MSVTLLRLGFDHNMQDLLHLSMSGKLTCLMALPHKKSASSLRSSFLERRQEEAGHLTTDDLSERCSNSLRLYLEMTQESKHILGNITHLLSNSKKLEDTS